MSTPVPSSPAAPTDTCPLCGTPTAGFERCPTCGYHLAGMGSRPGPWTRPAMWWTAAGLLVVYAITLLIVALAR